MVTLIYPAKALIKVENDKEPYAACEPLYEMLGSDGIYIFKDIFENNNGYQR